MIVTHRTNQAISHAKVRRAFTILELIVAISITVIMLLLINALFQATSNGVSMGMALSDVIGAGRAIGDQIERDATEQFSPIGNPPGVLVIICEKLDPVPYRFRGVEKTRSARSDQLMFTRRLQGASKFNEEPITPIDNSTYSSASKTQMAGAEAIRVWYGHVLKTNDLGTAVTGIGAPGRNQYANQLALGRHALFLVGGPTAPTFNRATGAVSDAAVAGISLTGVASPRLFNGLTDVAHLRYQGGATEATAAPGVFIVGETGSGGINPGTLWLGDANYHTKALSYMFTGTNRLWTNPFPKIDPIASATWVTAGQVAQMHPLLMDNISDFIVEFAADAVDDNDPDTMTTDGFDGEPDRDLNGEIIWYGLAPNPATNSQGPPASWDLRDIPGLVSPVASSSNPVSYVFQHGGDNGKLWPYMIRIRYRVHDSRALLGGDPSPEPGDTSNAGRWFEQIIKVRRE